MTAELTNYRQQIVVAHASASGAMRDAVTHAVRVGELLAQAKAALPRGSFGAFCTTLPFAATTARGYMRLAALDPANRQRVADMPLRAALLELAEPRSATPHETSSIVIPLGSFGVTAWQGTAGTIHWFEVHPVLWPDGVTIGLHYALAEVAQSGNVICTVSRRPVAMAVEELAGALPAPLKGMRVVEGQPVLWAKETPS